MTKKAQQDYDKKWIESNREHKRYLSYRSSARTFIRNHATSEDIENLEELLKKRKKILENT